MCVCVCGLAGYTHSHSFHFFYFRYNDARGYVPGHFFFRLNRFFCFLLHFFLVPLQPDFVFLFYFLHSFMSVSFSFFFIFLFFKKRVFKQRKIICPSLDMDNNFKSNQILFFFKKLILFLVQWFKLNWKMQVCVWNQKSFNSFASHWLFIFNLFSHRGVFKFFFPCTVIIVY